MSTPRLEDPKKNCAQCGALMQRKRFNSGLEDRGRFKQRKYCDQKCMAAAMEGRMKIPSRQNSRRQSLKMRKDRCENCGVTSRLHAHHRDSNPMNNDLSNIQTLCASCHMHTHWREWRVTKFPLKSCKHCEKRARHRGLCNTHYTRFRRHGDPLLRRERQNGVWRLVRDSSP